MWIPISKKLVLVWLFFAQLNNSNSKLKGNIFTLEDNIKAIIAKIENFSAFDTVNKIVGGQCVEIE